MTGQRLSELAERAARRDTTVFSRFLDPAACLLAQQAAHKAGVQVLFEGGQPDAERKMAVFFTDNGTSFDWPIVCIEARWDARYGSVKHPDLLGATLALVQDRGCYGDILLTEGQAYLFVIREMAEHVAQSLTEAGRVRLHNALLEHWPQPPPPRTRSHRDTVASLRLDALLASAFRLSRAQAQERIREGRVKVNHLPILQPDNVLTEGDLLSLRGHGRAQLATVGGKSRKGRLSVVWSCFE